MVVVNNALIAKKTSAKQFYGKSIVILKIARHLVLIQTF